MQIGTFIRDNRKSKGWTQAYAAREIGIQQSYLSKIENSQLIPSQEVLLKIQSAYNLSDTRFTPFLHVKENKFSLKKRYICLFGLGFFMLICGYLELFFNQTYYTYKAQNIETTKVANYHVTDKYQGEKYSEIFAKQNYQYVLIGERNVARNENSWLKAIGYLLLLLTLCLFIRDNRLRIEKT